MRKLQLCFTLLSLLISSRLLAQNVPGAIWKNRISHLVRISPTNAKNNKPDSSFLRLLMEAAKAGNITAYSNSDSHFRGKLTKEQVAELTSLKIDSTETTRNGEAVIIVTQSFFDWNDKNDYRIVENWEFDHVQGKTTIQIEGLAPQHKIFMGEKSAVRTMYSYLWFKYNEIGSILKQCETTFPNNNIYKAVWDERVINKHVSTGTKLRAIRTINMQGGIDTMNQKIRDEKDDLTIMGMIYNAVKAGKINAYANPKLAENERADMPKIEKKIFHAVYDSVEALDPVTREQKNYVLITEFDFSLITRYAVLEEWAFDANTGKTTIQVIALAPINDFSTDKTMRKGSPIFWVKYNDVIELLKIYEEMYPYNNLWRYIWDDYFLSDKKPAAVEN